ncbi:CD9 antigen isoform X2 [Chanos chanos]|uniref:Tetraspanin n=1 Tax=Chanos chanos TaxID=29144 RepID=A0A6J2WZA0_CHACN|nr:CD9 antigen-like isoform X2 [Chanos chanos]
MAVDGCGQLCKCILILFNILFAILGFAMMGLGLWLRFSSETRGFFDIDLNTQAFTIGVIVLIVVGAVMLVVSAFGDHGACNENKTALGIFSFLLTIMACIEIAAGILAFTYSDKVSEELQKFYTTIYAQYLNQRQPSQAVVLKIFHNALDCCGLGGAIEIAVRDTCPDVGFLKSLTYSSCPVVIGDLFQEKAPLVMGFFLGTAGCMFLALVCCGILCNSIKNSRMATMYTHAVY